MSTYITYFVHGTTTDNERDIATGWLPGELSDLGEKQSKELGITAKTKYFDTIFSSDLKRAVDSAAMTFPGQKVTADKRLREINYGDLNGQPDSFKDSLTDYIDKPFPNGESYHDVEKRINEFLELIKKNFSGLHVAIVAHQAPQLALEVLLKGKSWTQAIAEDWRRTKSWQPGWEYEIK
ncbi:MAG: histidine phosphatase family protein [Patescibacteria group bacterium]